VRRWPPVIIPVFIFEETCYRRGRLSSPAALNIRRAFATVNVLTRIEEEWR